MVSSIRRELRILCDEDSDLNLVTARDRLRKRWGAASVKFLHETGGEEVHGRTKLSNLIDRSFALVVEFAKDGGKVASDDAASDQINHATLNGAKDRQASAPHATQGGGEDVLYRHAIRAIARVRRAKDFLWAGYVIGTVLPSLGIDARRAQLMFDELVAGGAMTLRKIPNPKHPDRQTTVVELDATHPEVRSILESMDRAPAFKPIEIRGEPLSETILRERR